MITKSQLLKDLNYCKDSLERMIWHSEKQKDEYHSITNHTVIENDIIKLRRELNEIRVSLNPFE